MTDTETNVGILIIKIIIGLAPRLPFKSSSDLRCKAKSEGSKVEEPHGQIKSKKSTPFHEAARFGNEKAIAYMIHHALQSYQTEIRKDEGIDRANAAHDRLLDIMKKPVPQSYGGDTALYLAAMAEEPRVSNALVVLLDFDTRLADPPDKTFKFAAGNGLLSIVDKFLEYERLKAKFATGDNLLKALDDLGTAKKESCSSDQLQSKQNIVFHLMQSNKLDDKVIDKIIELDLSNVWESVKGKMGSEIEKRGLLHRAVRHQNVGFVKKFLEEYPNSVTHRALLRDDERTSDVDTCYPLWHNNKVFVDNSWRDRPASSKRNTIRSLIVNATIKSKDIKRLRDLPEIFHNSNGKHPSEFHVFFIILWFFDTASE